MNGNPDLLKKEFSTIWKLSLISFVTAALTGFLYRYGFLGPLPGWLYLDHIRHAHSHLMFFNWITPPVMVWMAGSVIAHENKRSIRQFNMCLYVMMSLGFISWPFFLLYGYMPVSIGSASLPIAAMLSGLVMLTWYWFGLIYASHRKKLAPSFPLLLFDGALIALILSSLGAWGVSVYQFSTIESPLISKALTSFFLSVFTEGWVMLGVLGVIWSSIGNTTRFPKTNSGLYWIPILFGSMLIFPYSLSQSVLTPAMLYSAKAGLLLILLSLAAHLRLLIKHTSSSSYIWRAVWLLLALKILLQAGALLPTGVWPGEHGLRILYLHVTLLGFASTALILSFHSSADKKWIWFYLLGATSVLITLGMYSGYWPAFLIPDSLIYWLAAAALLPALPAAFLIFRKV